MSIVTILAVMMVSFMVGLSIGILVYAKAKKAADDNHEKLMNDYKTEKENMLKEFDESRKKMEEEHKIIVENTFDDCNAICQLELCFIAKKMIEKEVYNNTKLTSNKEIKKEIIETAYYEFQDMLGKNIIDIYNRKKTAYELIEKTINNISWNLCEEEPNEGDYEYLANQQTFNENSTAPEIELQSVEEKICKRCSSKNISVEYVIIEGPYTYYDYELECAVEDYGVFKNEIIKCLCCGHTDPF